MSTQVVNLRHAAFDVYIGRAGHGHDGYFGNPGKTVYDFKTYFDQRIVTDPDYRTRIEDLRGKTLGCFCKPKPCHGDIIVSWLVEGKT